MLCPRCNTEVKTSHSICTACVVELFEAGKPVPSRDDVWAPLDGYLKGLHKGATYIEPPADRLGELTVYGYEQHRSIEAIKDEDDPSRIKELVPVKGSDRFWILVRANDGRTFRAEVSAEDWEGIVQPLTEIPPEAMGILRRHRDQITCAQ